MSSFSKSQIFILLFLVANCASGDPLDKTQVSADAKWLVHVDLSAFRSTDFGKQFYSLIQEKHLKKAEEDIHNHLGVSFDFDKIKSLTAYGDDYKTDPHKQAVLLIQSDQDLKQLLDELVRKPFGIDEEKVQLTKRAGENGMDLYSLNDEIYGSLLKKDLLVIGRSEKNIEESAAVIAGKAKNLTDSQAFSGYPEIGETFFFIATADAFNKNVPIPPQAKFLQQAEGGRIVLGEAKGNLFLNFALKTANEETGNQVSQVISGMLALMRLSQEDPNLTQLINSAKVSQSGSTVSVQIHFPSDRAVAKVKEEIE